MLCYDIVIKKYKNEWSRLTLLPNTKDFEKSKYNKFIVNDETIIINNLILICNDKERFININDIPKVIILKWLENMYVCKYVFI